MKRIFLSAIYCLAIMFTVQAQVLYSTTSTGGIAGAGTISKFIPATNALTVVKSFSSNDLTDGSTPTGTLLQAGNGKLYGMTQSGGANNLGVIYSLNPADLSYTKLKDFDGTNGGSPSGNSLIQAKDGKLYGIAGGGSNSSGVIFSFDPATSAYTKLVDFNGDNGASPSGSLVQAIDGKLYGITFGGGSFGDGVIFSYDPVSATYTVLNEITRDLFANPRGSLMQAGDGKLYGMTYGNDRIEAGAIFSFDPTSSTFTPLMDFDFDGNTSTYPNGAYPVGNLIQATDGKLYGMTVGGGIGFEGVIFSFNPLDGSYTKLKDLVSIGDGFNPLGTLLQASDGKLYGTTNLGGSNSLGVIFSFDPATSTYAKLADYSGANGAKPDIGSGFIEVKECVTTTFYQDADKDGYGNHGVSVQACTQPAGYVTNDSDCNDNNAAIHAPVTYYRDVDRDGFGDANNSISVCETSPPAGYVRNNYDCDDHLKEANIFNEKLVMCHNGREECVKIKDVLIRLFAGWTLGPCSTAPCGPNETLMCHRGKEECVKRKDVFLRLFEGWTLGPCFSNNSSSPNTLDITENLQIYGKGQLIPGDYKLSNYPNPFAGTTTIKYDLPFDSKVSLKVYDVMGREIATLVNENKKAGSYTTDFKAGSVSGGSLFYRLMATSGDKHFEQTNKMVQVK